jgi:hypothetical protein
MQPQPSNETSSPWYEAFSPPDRRPVQKAAKPRAQAAPAATAGSGSSTQAAADMPAEALFDCYNG